MDYQVNTTEFEEALKDAEDRLQQAKDTLAELETKVGVTGYTTKDVATDQYLTNHEAAQLTRLSEVTLWRLRRTGELPFHRVASKVLFRRSDLEQFLAKGRREGADRHEE